MGGRLGMLGGTFDPPHVGHLIVAQDVLEGLALDRLLIIPAGDPPHRAAVLPAEVRLELVSQAFGGNPCFEVCRIEVDRTGPSFTVDTLRWIRRTMAPEELYCVIGVDQLRLIDSWSRYEEIPEIARLAVMARDGEAPPADDVPVPFETVAVTRVDISGSAIRGRLREGRSIRHLVPERIRERVEVEWARVGNAAPESEDA
ncbi:MAG: nicotinate-nucleotide adenylyltransferase [Gemmatimonadota bacterium]